jgi:hypothetical protein
VLAPKRPGAVAAKGNICRREGSCELCVNNFQVKGLPLRARDPARARAGPSP